VILSLVLSSPVSFFLALCRWSGLHHFSCFKEYPLPSPWKRFEAPSLAYPASYPCTSFTYGSSQNPRLWLLCKKIVERMPSDQRRHRPNQSGQDEDTENRELTYMTVASEIRRVLHSYGIHSSTVQPEYALDGMDEDTASLHSACLIPCMTDADCDPANACCPPTPRATD